MKAPAQRILKRFLPFAVALGSACAFVHCGANGDSAFTPDNPTLIPDGGGEGGGSFGADGAIPIPPSGAECIEENKQIYVLGTDRFLYRFYPDQLMFTQIGEVACPDESGTFSMAVNRFGIAYVEFQDGRLFAVDTSTAICYTTPFQYGQKGFETFGMGYARNGAAAPDAGDDAALADDGGDDGGDEGGLDAGTDGAVSETLYVSGAGLASLDTNNYNLNFLGSLTYGRTELTGQDNLLFAFSIDTGVIAGLDKTTAATISTYRTTAISEMAAFAFAQWGGSFWVFTGDDHSMVTQFDPVANTSKVVMQNTGMLIVGAGSSTCAPSVAPH